MTRQIALALVLSTAGILHAQDSKTKADLTPMAALEQSAKSGGGVACVTQPDHAEAALALARNRRRVVHVLLAERTPVEDARQKAGSVGK